MHNDSTWIVKGKFRVSMFAYVYNVCLYGVIFSDYYDNFCYFAVLLSIWMSWVFPKNYASCLLECSDTQFCLQTCLTTVKCNACVEPVTTGVANIFKVIWVIFCASLERLVVILNQLSSNYREVSRQLAKEKKQKKLERQASKLLWQLIYMF